MKRITSVFFISVFVFSAYAQAAPSPRLATVAVLPFETIGAGVSAAEANEATRLLIAEISSWGTVILLPEDQADRAEYLIRGRVSRPEGPFVISADTIRASPRQTLNTSRQEAPSLRDINIAAFSAQVAENIPFPNFLIGRWRSTIDIPNGPLVAIMEFRANRTILVERYDTWEHSGTNCLIYQAIGTGTYTHIGYLRRNVNIGGRVIQSDATVGINLNLEDAIPMFTNVRTANLRILFDEERNNFEIVHGGLPCGINHTGPSVYPRERLFYTRFTRIQ